MCDNVDGAATCVSTFACNALNAALKKAAGKPDTGFLKPEYGLWKMENDPFLNRPLVIIGETCILALTVISYILPKKDHLVPIFQEALAENIDMIIQREQLLPDSTVDMVAANVILRARFSLMLGYYADMLFQQHADAFNKTMKFLFESVGYELQHESVVTLQSIDTLCTIVSDADLAPRLDPILGEIIAILN
jgi:hypothetical protein